MKVAGEVAGAVGFVAMLAAFVLLIVGPWRAGYACMIVAGAGFIIARLLAGPPRA